MLGNNVVGKSAGTLMAAGAGIASKLPGNRESASALKEAHMQARVAQKSIPELRDTSNNLLSQKKIAEARYDSAKALYGPKSEKMQWAQEQVSQFKGGVDEANNFVGDYDKSVIAEQSTVDKMTQALSENPDNTAAANKLAQAQDSLVQLQDVEPKVNNVRQAVEYMDKSSEYKDAKSDYEDISAQEAQVRMQIHQAERKQTRDGLVDYLQKIQ